MKEKLQQFPEYQFRIIILTWKKKKKMQKAEYEQDCFLFSHVLFFMTRLYISHTALNDKTICQHPHFIQQLFLLWHPEKQSNFNTFYVISKTTGNKRRSVMGIPDTFRALQSIHRQRFIKMLCRPDTRFSNCGEIPHD